VKCLGLGTLTAKAIASRIGRAYDYGLRMILANLCEREPAVLVSSNTGYRLAHEATSTDQQPRSADASTNGHIPQPLIGRMHTP
jgi:hypothetical protein